MGDQQMKEQASIEILMGAVVVLFFALYALLIASGIHASTHASAAALSADQNASLQSSKALLVSCSCLIQTGG